MESRSQNADSPKCLIVLGSVIDKKASFKQYMFLPDYVHLGLQNSSLNKTKTIVNQKYILPDYDLKRIK